MSRSRNIIPPRFESGSILISLVLCALPLVFILTALSVDLLSYFRETRHLQRVADDAALQAVKLLPFKDRALEAAQSIVRANGFGSAQINPKISTDRVGLRIHSNFYFNFANFLGVRPAVPLEVYSQAALAPVITLIAIDTSAYLAPALNSSTIWGNAKDWSIPEYFQRNVWAFEGGVPLFSPHTVAAHCFNPGFNALKLTALGLYDYLQRFESQPLGVVAFPGSKAGLDILRHIHSSSDFHRVLPDQNYRGAILRDALCMKVAESERKNRRYTFPTFTSAAPLHSLLLVDSQNPLAPELNPLLLTPQTVPQLIWGRAVREQGNVDFIQLMDQLYTGLHSRQDPALSSRTMGPAQYRIVILLGDVPIVSGQRVPDGNSLAILRQRLDAIELLHTGDRAAHLASTFSIALVIFEHQGNTLATLDISRANALKNFLAAYSQELKSRNSLLSIELYFNNSEDFFDERLISILSHRKRVHVVAR